MKKLLLTALLFMGTQTALQAQFSIQAGFANNKANFNELKFLNPVGAGAGGTTNPTVGNYISLSDTNKKSSTSGLALVLGYEVIDNLNLTLAYRDFGKFTAKGYATFGGTAFKQELTAKATAFGLGMNYNFDLTSKIFVAPLLEFTSANLAVKGTQGATGVFPSKTYNKTGLGFGLNLGYRVTSAFDALFTYYGTSFAQVDTGKTGTPPPAGMNTGEQLQSKLNISTMALSVRYNFGS